MTDVWKDTADTINKNLGANLILWNKILEAKKLPRKQKKKLKNRFPEAFNYKKSITKKMKIYV